MVLPLALIALGMGFTLIGVIACSRRGFDGQVSAMLLLVATLVYTIIVIPVCIVSLMVIGQIHGIDYGSLSEGVRSLTAITMLVNGIHWLSEVHAVMWYLAPLAALTVTCVLLLVFFRLDLSETKVSLWTLNSVLYLTKLLFIMSILAVFVSSKQPTVWPVP